MKNEERKIIKVLFGFDSLEFIMECKRLLISLNYDLEYTQKYSKSSIKDFLKTHPEYEVAVIKEVMGKTKYTDNEIAELCDSRDINVIPVLGEAHRGTPFMQTLYNAGVTSALFMSATSGSDATPEHVVKLILKKRTREKARDYYKISTGTLGIDVLTPQQAQDAIAAIMDSSYGKTPGERFYKLCATLKTKQAFQLINELPPDLRKELEKYDEFYSVLLKLKDKGVAINKKSWNAGMEAVLKKKKLEGKKKPVLEVKEDSEYIIRQQQEEIKREELREEYMRKGGTYDVPSETTEDEYVGTDELNVSGSIYAENTEQSLIEPAIEKVETPTMEVPPMNQTVVPPMNNPMQMQPNMQGMQGMPNMGYTPYQQPNPANPMMQPMPPMTDWKAMKKWQKEQAKMMKVQQKEQAKNERDALRNQRMESKKAPKVEKVEKVKRPKAAKIKSEPSEMRPFFIRIIITVAALALIAVIVTIVLASTKVSQQQIEDATIREEVLAEQMNDLAELRNDLNSIDVSSVTPRVTTISNGQSIMGIEVMDTINSSNEMFYVITLDGQVFTFENGGATSNEIDLNSMYRCQLLSSGRFTFVQL